LTALNTLLAGVCLPVLDLRNERCADCNNEYLKWEEAMKYYGTETVNKGWWYPTKSVYPNVKGSNFDCSQMTDRPGPDLNGHPQPEITFVGTASSPASYGRNSGASSGWWVDQDNPTQLIWKNARGNPPKDVNGNVYTDDYRLTRNVWSSLLLDQQLARGIRRSRPDVNLHSWIASYLFSEAGTQYFKDTRYYYENMRHYALLGTEIFLYWNSVGGNLASNRIAVTRAVDSVLDDINSKLGGSKVVETVTLDPIQFTSASSSYYDSSRILTTGARTIDGTYVWRTTFGPGVTRIKNNTTGIVSDLGNEVGIWNTTTVPVPPSYSIMTPNIFAFYDGSTGVYENYTWVGPGTGRYADARVDAAGGEYMYYVQLTDAGYAVGFNQAGWTSGTPYDWFTGQEVEGMVKTLVLQGATFTTKGYAYVNWTEDDREFFLLNGHTGPGTTMGCCFRTAADHDKLQKSVAKYFAGGTSSKDGLFYNGLRHYFPGISFGVYNLPPWYWSDNMWVKSTQEINDALERAANVIAGCTALMDAIQLLMPSCYSVVSSKEMMRVRNWQAMRLCNSINNKLITNGKQPKQIVPFVQPFYETVATGNPYNFTTIYTTPANSWSRNVLGLTLIQFRHTPPFTRKLENDLLYETYEPIIYNGGNAMTIWLNPAYRMKTIAGRTLSSIPGTEDEVVSSPYINAEGRLDWNNGWRKGVTGATAVWSDKDMRRQAIAADWTYQAGICLGITGNRWWWRNNQTISGPYGVCGPAEWFPLSGREGVTTGNQPISAAGMSTKNTRDKIDRYLMDNIINNVTTFKNGWLNINKNGLIPPS